MAASSRLRTYQFLPFWEKYFEQVEVAPLLNQQYLQGFYAGKKSSKLNILMCYLKRLLILFRAYRYDLIWVEKELFPFLPPFAEWVLSRTKGYVVDYDDAIFHNYDCNRSALIRRLLPRKIDKVMRFSDLVWTGNPYLMDRAQAAGARRVCFLPTVIDPARYRLKTYTPNPVTCIGWIGSPTTQKYLKALLPVFEALHRQFPIRILLVNGTKALPFSGEITVVPWTEEGEVDAILQMDIGIMPLPDSPWERGKCAYKLIQYMACGLPVVASPVGFNATVVTHGDNGYLAASPEAWQEHLTDLILHPEKRQTMGQQGYCRVQENYTVERNMERIREEMGDFLP
jgi:glycosyltransferase involved in cell wall biosynthesis